MNEKRRVMVVPCTRDEFLALPPSDVAMLEVAVYLQGEDGSEGPFLPGWSSVGEESSLAAGQPVLAELEGPGPNGEVSYFVARDGDGRFHCEEQNEEER